MKNQFNQTPTINRPRSVFNLSHGSKRTFDAGYIVPLTEPIEILPGDSFNLQTSILGRLATPLHPIMDNLKLRVFSFYVPNRLLWDNWQKFLGERDNPTDSIDFTVPSGVANITESHDLLTNMGVPLANQVVTNRLIPRGYWRIFDDWFRDQRLMNSADVNTGDTNAVIDNTVDYTWYQLAPSCKEFDYFTQANTSPQKGDAIDLPITGNAPIHHPGDTFDFVAVYADTANQLRRIDTDATHADISSGIGTTATQLYADLTQASGVTINELRQSLAIQRILEREARSGSRYIEILASAWGVRVPDFRLQRSEILSISTHYININPIAQTSETGTTEQGNLAAMGVVTGDSHRFSKSFVEHGYLYILGVLNADLSYQQGRHKMWGRSTRFDFYDPMFHGLGEQVLSNGEIYWQGTTADDDVFGYVPYADEYRHLRNNIGGKFLSNATASLDSWHLSQDFASLPVLNADFIKDTPPVDRVIAVPSEPHLILDCYHRIRAARPLPVYGIPKLGDRF